MFIFEEKKRARKRLFRLFFFSMILTGLSDFFRWVFDKKWHRKGIEKKKIKKNKKKKKKTKNEKK